MRNHWDKAIKGRISENRDSWITVKPFEVILFVGNEGDNVDRKDTSWSPPPYESHIMYIRTPQNKLISFELTAMTENEVLALKAFFNQAFNKALPVCKWLDDDAEKSFQTGDDSYARLYRPEPQAFERVEVDGKRIAVPISYKENDEDEIFTE